MYALLPDPEWSLQLLPFVCRIAAIPLMALIAYRLTGNAAVALLAGAVTSLVQLLAHYTVFVHQYTLEAVITALFLLAATRLVRDGTEVDARRFRCVALAGGAATFFSVPAAPRASWILGQQRNTADPAPYCRTRTRTTR